MDISLDLYKIFYVVAKNKNMSKASEELFISQPAISQSIKKIENQLGGALFLRSKKGMELTEEGKMLYAYIKNAMELIENAENEFTSYKQIEKGEIKIGCSTTLTKLFLLDKIEKYHNKYQNIKIDIINELTSSSIENLKLGKLDFVVFLDDNVDTKDILVTKIGEIKQGFLYNPNYFEDTFYNFKDLEKTNLILPKKPSNSRRFIDNILYKNGVNINPDIETVSQDLIIELTNIGLGIGFAIIDLSKQKYKNLKELKINKYIPKIPIYLGVNKSILPTFATKKFLDILLNNN